MQGESDDPIEREVARRELLGRVRRAEEKLNGLPDEVEKLTARVGEMAKSVASLRNAVRGAAGAVVAAALIIDLFGK